MTTDELDRVRHRMDALIDDHDRLLEVLVYYRKAHDLTQEQVAERMGVTQPTVSELERYDANPTLQTLRRYAMAVEVLIETKVHDDRPRASTAFTARSSEQWQFEDIEDEDIDIEYAASTASLTARCYA